MAVRRTPAPRGEVRGLPVLPLRDVVVFPGMILPLFVGRERSLNALESAMTGDRHILLATQLDARLEDPGPSDLYPVGTMAEILQLLKLPDGTVKVLVEGKDRAEIKTIQSHDHLYQATVEVWIDKVGSSKELEALRRTVLSHFEQYVKLNQSLSVEIISSAHQVDDICRLGDLVASHMLLKVEQKQAILATRDPRARLETVSRLLHNEIEILGIEKKIFSRVRKQMEKSQKEYFLKEQLRAIHQELGQEDARSAEINELKSKLEKLGCNDEVRQVINKQIQRLEQMHQDTAEASVVRTYLDWLLDLPWRVKTEDKLDLKLVKKCLDEDHHGLDEVKERILEHLAVSKLTGNMQGAILCFVGPPGVGKTSLGRSIARSIGRQYVRVSLGGVRDEAEVRGHRRTYVGALPGRVIQSIKKAASANPVMLLDEVDKMSTDFRGDPSAALLEVLDPEQNREFSDHYLEVPFDLSDVLFITTSNMLDTIPGPLRDRMEIIRLPGYTDEEKLVIARRHLLPKQKEKLGLTKVKVKLDDAMLLHIIRRYTREAGVRELERMLGKLLRKIARRVVTQGKTGPVEVTEKDLGKYLGVVRFDHGLAMNEPKVGVATGLAYTSVGGDVLFVETTVMPGKGKLQLTGSLGDVMKESAHAALSILRFNAPMLGVAADFFEKHDLHVHVPEGATPKDGPSAGVCLFTSMVSAVLKRPVRNDVAMTGEITLRGDVLGVGGLKEKTLAAARLGIAHIILPYENNNQHAELPPTVREHVKIHYVKTTGDVLRLALAVPPENPAGEPKKAVTKSLPRPTLKPPPPGTPKRRPGLGIRRV